MVKAPEGVTLVSADSMRRIERDKDEEAKRQARLAEERAVLAEKLAEMRITVEARAGEDGHLYGSVGPRQVINAFLELGYERTVSTPDPALVTHAARIRDAFQKDPQFKERSLPRAWV